MKFRKPKGTSINIISAKVSLATDSMIEAAFQLEQVADHLSAKDMDMALRLSRLIQMFSQNLRDGFDEIR